MPPITLRPTTATDRDQVLAVEKKSTPGLQYLPFVFDQFLSDPRGEFSVAEIDGEIVACAKFTALPDNSAWLETIRVTPERQGLGIGKRFYENYFDIANREAISTMRMYTGISNAVSKGLAEHFGFTLAETFYGMTRPVRDVTTQPTDSFKQITNPEQVINLVMPHSAEWGNYLVMNRTFYSLTPALCTHMATQGMVYASAESTLIAGARFMPESALHIGFYQGDPTACLAFANQLAKNRAIPQLSCLFPDKITATKNALLADNYQTGRSKFIVMESA